MAKRLLTAAFKKSDVEAAFAIFARQEFAMAYPLSSRQSASRTGRNGFEIAT